MALLKEAEDYRQAYTLDDFTHPHATHIQIALGLQPDGSRLTLIDLDTHHAGQNADAARDAFERERPELARLFSWHRSRGGKGWHALVKSYKDIPAGKLFDGDGRHIGEIVTTRTLDPGDVAIGVLKQTQIEQLLSYWSVEGGTLGGERWRGRAAEGQRYAGLWRCYRATRPELIGWLHRFGGPVGMHLAELFNVRKTFNRSDAAGNLMQCLMFHVHKELPNAGYSERCARAMALWMAADSYGKAGDKEYNQELDGYATIAKILAETPKLSGGHWRAPFWAKAHPTPPRNTPAPAVEPAPRRPAHRPAGDRDRMLAKIRRYLELRAFECDGRIIYHVDDLAERFCVSRRTMQTYLHDLEHIHGLITRGQEPGPGGRAWLIWGADNSENQPQNNADDAPNWGADACAIEPILAPETADRPSQCKEDHQNPCAPAPAALGRPAGRAHSGDLPSAPAGARPQQADLELASYDLRRDCIGGSGVWLDTWHDPTTPRMRLNVSAPPPPRARWQARPKGQQSFLGRDGEQIGARYGKRKRAGELPTPGPYRERACMQEETLPGHITTPMPSKRSPFNGDETRSI